MALPKSVMTQFLPVTGLYIKDCPPVQGLQNTMQVTSIHTAPYLGQAKCLVMVAPEMKFAKNHVGLKHILSLFFKYFIAQIHLESLNVRQNLAPFH